MSKLKIMSTFSIVVIAMLSLLAIMPTDKQAKDSTTILFQDFEGEDDVFTVTDNVEGSLTSEDVYEGKRSLKYEVKVSGDPSIESGSISFKAIKDSVDVSESKYLILYIKDTQGSNTLKVSLMDSSGNSSGFNWKSPSTEKDKWVQYHIPMDGFNNIDKANITEIRIGQWNEGIYYIDNVFFTNILPPAPPASPEAYKPSGEYDKSVIVELRSKAGNLPIYYTIDGTEPDKNTEQYTKPLIITSDRIIKAVTYDPEHDLYSEYSTFEYIIHNQEDIIEPKFSPSSGTYFNKQSITLTTPTDDAIIYYTLDGSTPTKSSHKYTEPIQITKNTVIKAISVQGDDQSEEVVSEYVITNESSAFLKADGKILRNNFGSGDQVTLRGTNVGGWLVMEEWMSPVNSPDQKTTIETLTNRFGSDKAWELINIYQDHYWQESDFDNVKKEGMNVLRLPFTYFEMLNDDGSLKSTAFDRLDWFIQEAEKRELYVILDLHGAPGSQNGKDHSGDTSNPDGGNLYGNEENMNRTVFLWQKVAERYKNREWVAGYDVLNEPEGAHGEEQFQFYDRLYKAIRAVDKDHVIYFEAIWEPTDLPNPEVYQWENVVYSYHFYGWDDIDGFLYQRDFTDSKVRMVNELTNYNIPLLVGEFTLFNNIQSWEYALSVYEEQQWNYTTWTYKVTGLGSSWGLYTGEPPRVDIYHDTEEEIREKWSQVGTNTSFVRNDYIADTLRNYSNPTSRVNDERTLITDFEDLDANVNFKTGENAIAWLDFDNKSSGDASLQLIVKNDSNIKEQYVSIKAPENEVLNIASKENAFPKYLVFDLYNGTNSLQRAHITFVDRQGNKASAWTHESTQALANSWSKVPLLLSSVDGDIDKTAIVEIRVAMKNTGAYNFDNLFIGQSFANELPERSSEDQDKTDPNEENSEGEEPEGQNPEEENSEGGDPSGHEPDKKDPEEDDPKDTGLNNENTDQPEANDGTTNEKNDLNNTTNEDVSINQNEEKGSHVDSGKELPNTASNIYNYLFIGIVLLFIGSIFYFRKRKVS